MSIGDGDAIDNPAGADHRPQGANDLNAGTNRRLKASRSSRDVLRQPAGTRESQTGPCRQRRTRD
jgi:hypothetical protein